MTNPPLTLDWQRVNVYPFLEPTHWNAKILPHYGFGQQAGADFHASLNAALHNLHEKRGSKLAFIAPRGGAKSTWITLAYVLRCALEGWERHIILLSDSEDQAKKFLAFVGAELEQNKRIANLYPKAFDIGPVWSTERIIMNNGVMIECLGRGQKIHGRRHRQHRPSLVVLDDVQSQKDMVSPTLRQQAVLWFTRAVLPAGDENTNFISVGTAIHREAIAVQALTMPGWVGETFPAIHGWPKNMEMWNEWERIFTNLGLKGEERKTQAHQFYLDNQATMDAGARSYWSWKWPLERLMGERAGIGEAAFSTEYQGVPTNPEGTEWPAMYFDWGGLYFNQWPTEDIVAKVVSLDPSKGSTDTSDWQAHAMIALTKDGTIWIDAEHYREDVHRMVQRMFEVCQRFGPVDSVVVEDNATMGLLEAEVERATQERGILLPWQTLTQTAHKEIRIRRAGPYLARRVIRVRNSRGGRELVTQWRDFPMGIKDDSADAVGTGLARLQLLVNGG